MCYDKLTSVSEKDQQKFVSSLEGIGDILVFEVERGNRNKLVVDALKRLKSKIARLFLLKQTNPNKFEQLLFSKEFFKLYRENKQKAQLRLEWAPDKYLISFSTGINQLVRIHRTALANKNDEISRNATYQLTSLLADLVKLPGLGLFVEELQNHLRDVKESI